MAEEEAPDPREPLARIAWKVWTDWIAERPLHQPEDDVPWEKLGASSRELCMRIAAAAAGEAGARLAEIRQAITTFQAVRVCGPDANDLAEAVRQILDREPQP